jgi:hypothetical protein
MRAAFDKIAAGLTCAIGFAKDVSAKRKHEWHEEMDLITSGQHGYWKQEPYWPRKPDGGTQV